MPVEIFSKSDFEDVIFGIRDGWKAIYKSGEWRYSVEFGEHGVVHVASSVGFDGLSKSTGEDSIRVWVEYDGKNLKKSKRWTTRLPGWEVRLREQVSSACKTINDYDYSPKCPLCDGAMVLRSGVHGKFYGCLRFPKCRGTRNYEEKVPEELEWLTR